jgi:uncharacterized membrane protein YcjF (UPF0283 family)
MEKEQKNAVVPEKLEDKIKFYEEVLSTNKAALDTLELQNKMGATKRRLQIFGSLICMVIGICLFVFALVYSLFLKNKVMAVIGACAGILFVTAGVRLINKSNVASNKRIEEVKQEIAQNEETLKRLHGRKG